MGGNGRLTLILFVAYYENSDVSLPIQAEGPLAYAGFDIWPNTSTVYQAFNDWSADSFISRVLADPQGDPYWTLLINPLQNEGGTDGAFGGLYSIGELVNITQIFNVTEDQLRSNNFPDLSRVTEYPWLNNTGSYGGVTYYAIIDAIKWGDVSATLESTVPGTPSGKISAYIDSTYSWIQVPYAVTEQLYKNLPDATYNNGDRLWYFTCTELNVNITIAGYDYPLSPLTAVQQADNGKCVGTVSRDNAIFLSTYAYTFSGSSKPRPRMSEAMLFLVFPSVRLPLLERDSAES